MHNRFQHKIFIRLQKLSYSRKILPVISNPKKCQLFRHRFKLSTVDYNAQDHPTLTGRASFDCEFRVKVAVRIQVHSGSGFGCIVLFGLSVFGENLRHAFG